MLRKSNTTHSCKRAAGKSGTLEGVRNCCEDHPTNDEGQMGEGLREIQSTADKEGGVVGEATRSVCRTEEGVAPLNGEGQST